MLTVALGSLGLAGLLFGGAGLGLFWPRRAGLDGAQLGTAILDGVALLVPLILLAGLVAARTGAFFRVITLGPAVLAIPIGAVALVRLGRHRVYLRPAAGATVFALAVGLWMRRDPVYFLGQWTDFGEYVNRGNSVADGGIPGGYFPPLTEVAVGIGHHLFGEAHTVQIFPLLAAVTGVFIGAIVGLLTRSTIASIGSGFAFAVHPTAAWFGRLPTSEAVYAMLLALFVYQVSRSGTSKLRSVSTAMIVACLVLTRPNGLIDVLPFAAACILASLAGQGHSVRRLIPAVAAGWSMGFLWLANFGFLRGVFVSVSNLVGPDSSALAEQVQHPLSQLAMITAAGLGALALSYLCQRIEVIAETGRTGSTRFLIAAAMGVVLGAIVLSGQLFVLRDGLRSFGWPLLSLAVLGVCFFLLAPQEGAAKAQGGITMICALTAMWAFVYSQQFEVPLPHFVFLYWERYLYPAVFLLSFVFAGAAFAAVERLGLRIGIKQRALSLGPPILLAVLLFLSPANTLQHRQVFHGSGFYSNLALVADAVPPDAILTYDGVAEAEILNKYYFFFPNTFRVVAGPLQDTFGLTFNNLAGAPAGEPDPLPIPETATHVLTVRIEPTDTPVGPTTVAIPIAILPRDSTLDGDWIRATLLATVHRVER